MRKLPLIIAIYFGCAHYAWAQQEDYYQDSTASVVEQVEEVDTYQNPDPVADTALIPRYMHPPTDSVNSWKRDGRFAYIHNLDSLLKASQQKEEVRPATRQPNPGSFMSRLLAGSTLKYLLWTLAIGFIGIIAFQLLKSKGLFEKASSSRVTETSDVADELLLQNDFTQLIGQAFKLGDYRTAVRYHFLHTLQQLQDKEHINYEPDKTNSYYVYELPEAWRNPFSKLVFQYEYVWYGHFDIGETQYENIRQGFENFGQKI